MKTVYCNATFTLLLIRIIQQSALKISIAANPVADGADCEG